MSHSSEPRLVLPFLKPFYDTAVPLSWLIIRLAAAGIFFVHGIGHVPSATFDKWSVSFVTRGYFSHAEFAYFILFIETVGAAGVAIGLFTRFFASAIAIELGVMAFYEFGPHGFNWNKQESLRER